MYTLVDRSDLVRGSSEDRGMPNISPEEAIWWTVVSGVLVILNRPRGPCGVGFRVIMWELCICELRGETEFGPYIFNYNFAIFIRFLVFFRLFWRRSQLEHSGRLGASP